VREGGTLTNAFVRAGGLSAAGRAPGRHRRANGTLAASLTQAAALLESDVARRLERLTAWLEPALVIAAGGLVLRGGERGARPDPQSGSHGGAMRGPARGFTLLEVMIVVFILGLLATIIVPRLAGRTDEARRVKVIADLKSIAQALDSIGWTPACTRRPSRAARIGRAADGAAGARALESERLSRSRAGRSLGPHLRVFPVRQRSLSVEVPRRRRLSRVETASLPTSTATPTREQPGRAAGVTLLELARDDRRAAHSSRTMVVPRLGGRRPPARCGRRGDVARRLTAARWQAVWKAGRSAFHWTRCRPGFRAVQPTGRAGRCDEAIEFDPVPAAVPRTIVLHRRRRRSARITIPSGLAPLAVSVGDPS
jgi:prepilin-type N-terminal cleavage/methylation domain-containing protein